MFNKKFLLLTAVLAAFGSVAEARDRILVPVAIDNNTDPYVITSGSDVTEVAPSGGQIDYQDKNLANYQDPYLTNPRGYKSNQYGEAAPAPKPNVFYTGPIYEAPYANTLVEVRTDEYIER